MRVVTMAMDLESRETVEKVEPNRDGPQLFEIAKQIAKGRYFRCQLLKGWEGSGEKDSGET